VTTWRLAGVAGAWSGWVEEIGVSFSGIIPVPQDFFRKAIGTTLPDGTSDYTSAITHNGFLGLGLSADPIAPLEFGDPVRNDVIRLSDGGSTSAHEFYGFGVQPGILRYQTAALTNTHSWYAGNGPTASKLLASLTDRRLTIGEPAAAAGEGHWAIGTEADNAYMAFNSPNIAAGANKFQARLYFDAFSGNSGITGSSIDFQTARADAAGTALGSRLLITGSGDTMISDPTVSYTTATGALASLTVNGAIRVRSGTIVPGNVRQTSGLVFGAGFAAGGLELGQETDGGISAVGDNNLTFFNNGIAIGNVTGGIWSKPGGGAWAATSDIRTKKNVKPFASRLSSLLQLEVITFNYNGKGGTIDSPKTYTGLSAQAVQKLFPEWVLEIKGEEIDKLPVLQVDNSALIYELLEAVKAQQIAIATLKAEVLALKIGSSTLGTLKLI
jgi:hypothetical protein